jgi:hypothetical protein
VFARSLASLEVFDIKGHAHHAQLYGFFAQPCFRDGT